MHSKNLAGVCSFDRRFDQMLEKLLLVRHFVTFEVAELTCHDKTCCDPEIRIIDLFSRTCHVFVTTRVD